ncbi:tRNA uridine(34) 5-carboxymethylaminomethyl modification radical SAM/GNAT enzyme Elp3, partial [Sulfolobus sp. D5]
MQVIRKPTRMLSGVTIVAVMTHPYPCPHGKCIFCPGGVEVGTPQSYYGREPTLMRAVENNYDPFYQVQSRLKQYVENGHTPSKVELIIMGGT